MGKVTLLFTVLAVCVLSAQAQFGGGSLTDLMLMQALMGGNQGSSGGGAAAPAPAAPAPSSSLSPALAASLMRPAGGSAGSSGMSSLGRAAALSALTRGSSRGGRGMNLRQMLMMRQFGMDQMLEMQMCSSFMPMIYCMSQMA